MHQHAPRAPRARPKLCGATLATTPRIGPRGGRSAVCARCRDAAASPHVLSMMSSRVSCQPDQLHTLQLCVICQVPYHLRVLNKVVNAGPHPPTGGREPTRHTGHTHTLALGCAAGTLTWKGAHRRAKHHTMPCFRAERQARSLRAWLHRARPTSRIGPRPSVPLCAPLLHPCPRSPDTMPRSL